MRAEPNGFAAAKKGRRLWIVGDPNVGSLVAGQELVGFLVSFKARCESAQGSDHLPPGRRPVLQARNHAVDARPMVGVRRMGLKAVVDLFGAARSTPAAVGENRATKGPDGHEHSFSTSSAAARGLDRVQMVVLSLVNSKHLGWGVIRPDPATTH